MDLVQPGSSIKLVASSLMVVAGACAHAGAPRSVALFDGRSLDGWRGDPALWRVDQGEIVGRIEGRLARNEFLVGNRVLRDFRLVIEVKLRTQDNNSGIQFRSRTIEQKGRTSVAGYQADIGGPAGVHWGKLCHFRLDLDPGPTLE